MTAGWDAAPAGGARNPASGRPPGHRPALLRASALNGWTRCGRRAAKAARIRAGKSSPSRTRKHGPGDRKAADGAPRGARALQKGARQDGRLVRHSVLHPLDLSRGTEKAPLRRGADYGVPGAAKNTGAGACSGANRASPARARASYPSPARGGSARAREPGWGPVAARSCRPGPVSATMPQPRESPPPYDGHLDPNDATSAC
jgi:hypothetical protein